MAGRVRAPLLGLPHPRYASGAASEVARGTVRRHHMDFNNTTGCNRGAAHVLDRLDRELVVRCSSASATSSQWRSTIVRWDGGRRRVAACGGVWEKGSKPGHERGHNAQRPAGAGDDIRTQKRRCADYVVLEFIRTTNRALSHTSRAWPSASFSAACTAS